MSSAKEVSQSSRSKRAEATVAEMRALGIKAFEQSKNVFRITGPLGVVTYYPPSNRWQHKGRTYTGPVSALRAWLQERGYL